MLVTGWGSGGTTNMTARVSGHGVAATRLYTGGAPSQALIDAAVAAAKQNDVTIALSYNSWSDPGQIALINALQATGKPVVVLATGAPYELGQLPTVTTFVAAYGYQPTSLRAAANVIFGAQPRGHLPVTIKAADGSVVAAFGSGMSYRH
ncbi:MAG: glycoside hydrolase family 3 C-terminal domain-containing protein [Actinomycetota bacterium]|nr:glycoside hydrolase family 3 C-terminal domain-containing protein [Actinomycetota bacterium]